MAGPDHPITRVQPGVSALREQTWLLGPSAADDAGVIPAMLRRINVPEDHQRIFQSHAAALEEAKRGKGLALALSFAVSQDLANGDLKRVSAPALQAQGAWSILDPDRAPGAAGRGRADPLRHHAAGHPGDAARRRRHRRPVPARRST